MVHPATTRAVRTAVTALGAQLDVGAVFPPRPGQARGFGMWQNLDLGIDDVLALLPRLAAENARGGNIYMRLGPCASKMHPGLTMIDDLDANAVQRLNEAGLEPCLVVETSPGNFQAWIRLIASGTVPYATMNVIASYLADAFDGDPRAVSPRQPGRLPGFTNRKPKHVKEDGTFPFTRIVSADPGRVASRGRDLIAKLTPDTAGRAAGAPPKTPRPAAQMVAQSTRPYAGANWTELSKLLDQVRAVFRDQIARGARPMSASSQSELDFLFARTALEIGYDPDVIAAFITSQRPDKASNYASATVRAAAEYARSAASLNSTRPSR